ncbi:MAG TPA: CDP-alcohol phosphatidyltransferase family protein [Longimicrobiaceae bacterium]|jgi:phosphatidylglycerophosphate synthase|nr:CDP-alcohol phosphatidyltransferase family protein [Longimicrobiaceae bacterium]
MTRTDTVALALVGALLLTMPVFAVVARGRPMDADVARRSKSVLLGHWVRDWLMWVIGPMERGLVRARVSPDVFNYLGVVFGLLAGVAFARGSLSLAGWMVLLGGAADIFDGRIARARGIAAPYGAFLDSTLDRFAETFAFAGVALFFQASRPALLATVLAMGASLLVSYARARGEALGVHGAGGVMQRAERLVTLALAALLDSAVTGRAGWAPGSLLAGAVALIALGALGTAVYRTGYVTRELKRRPS